MDITAFNTAVGAMDADTSTVYTAMGVIAVGLLAMWGIRKFIKTANRS